MAPKRILWVLACVIPLAAVALAQASQNADEPAEKAKTPDMMQCPMMACMKGMEMYADSPAVLLSQAEELELSDEQKEQLEEIEQSARQQARAVLTAEQQEQVSESPKGLLSMKDLCMMRMKNMTGRGGQKHMMCPMCMKMMKKKASSGQDEQNKEGPDVEK